MTKVLYVHAKGGPPVGYALPRVAARSTVHLLALSDLPADMAADPARLCASVLARGDADEHDLVELISSRAREVGADAVITFSEYAVVAVAEAARRLGLRGAGPTAALARDKRLMRAAWERRGIPQPRFRAVATEEQLAAAAIELTCPLLLKAAWSAGSTAHQIIEGPADVAGAWKRSRAVMSESALLGYAELHVGGAGEDFVVEEIVTGCAEEWFDGTGWGDYVSVEGAVVGGVFRPVCLSGRMPTVAPFTERAGITPAAVGARAQARIVELARQAVEALGLQDCGTHTEIKLGADGRMWVIETAARFGGAMTVPQIEEVFGLDLVGMFTDQLLGRAAGWPARALTPEDAEGAAGSLVVLAVDGAGAPWRRRHVWDSASVLRSVPAGAASTLSVVRESSLPDGTPVPVYDPAAGANTMAGLCLMSADRPQTVIRDFTALVDALPRILPAYVGEGVRA
ncbi:ATP-grasp domain-containing protein [Streptomyces collinus]|uniref:L-amino acid ligase n=1 Tax=Streptomyces collinus (strain DSM 40733 / Tue 365) TaxID=1214242 RepID=S5VDD1_STRC3|nr:ATP-grasp domain-containing protein [Streptomyces collinus]AGS73229.1 l-amino acid ligase [Streptomyces collinus Tu 365]UJA11895.1 ATP-grasp domain-containing protein [Streptomyces collinus]UJA13239.1 ATP-grasp domain-containing protein [Streptomyces collinus]